MNKKSLLKSATLVMVINVVSKLVGFIRDMLIAKSFGATYETDAYNMAITIPNVLFAIFALAITTTFIPILSECYTKHNKKDMFKLSNNIINILTLLSVVLAILGYVFSPQIVKVIAPKFTGRTYELTVQLTKLSIINILFMSLSSGYTAILQVLDDFIAPALVGIVMNIPIILYVVLGSEHNILGLTIVTIVGKAFEILIQIPWLIKNGYKYSVYINFKDKRVKKIIKLIPPVVLGAGVNQLNSIVDKTIGSGLPNGSITALDYATKVNGMVYTVFAMTIVTVIYPTLSKEASEKSFDNFKGYISSSINNITLIMLPSAIGLIVLSYPIVNVLFKRGVFDDRAAYMTSTALTFYAIGIVFYGIRDIFSRAFYAINDTKTPMINGAIGVVCNIILNLILVKYMGLGGLALSTSISSFICAILLAISLKSKIGTLNGMKILNSSTKILISSIVMGASVYFCNRFIFLGNYILNLLISILVGISLYLFMIFVLKVEEIDFVINKINKLIKK